MFLTKLFCPSVPESSDCLNQQLPRCCLGLSSLKPGWSSPCAAARDEVLVCYVAEVSQVDGRVVAILMLVTRTFVFPVMMVTALWEEVLPPMMAPATMALSLTVTFVRLSGWCSLPGVPADDVFRRGVSRELHMGVPSQRAGLEVGAPFIGDTSGDDAECSSVDVHPYVPLVVEVAGSAGPPRCCIPRTG